MKKNHLFTLVGFLTLMICSNITVKAAAFPDVPADHPYKEGITYVQTNNIVSGYPDGTFKPEATINRAEFTKILVSAQFTSKTIDECISLNAPKDSGTVFFPDIPKDTWYAKYICVANIHKIISGHPDGTFKPADAINFAESAKILSNAFGYPVTHDAVWYKPFVNNLAAKNAIPTTITAFNDQVNRGEMAEMVYRLKASLTTKPSLDYETLNTMMTVKVSFTTSQNNTNVVSCEKTEQVSRIIPYTSMPATAALAQLFKGPTSEEHLRGMQDFWITQATSDNLKSVIIKNGIAYLDWKDIREVIPNASTSCGSASFLEPIEATLKQFPTVTKVIHSINGDSKVFYDWMQIGCTPENNNCNSTPYKVSELPSSCVDQTDGLPVITSISRSEARVGDTLDIHGCNFSGFEGDLHAWIENSEGVKGILYSESGSTSKLLHVRLNTPLCQTDNSYSGLPCDKKLSVVPGKYELFVTPWGRVSNMADIVIME
ncbi:MAG: S-layer homology domain-containing protein [Candidatus Gracilibacteria bacterium]